MIDYWLILCQLVPFVTVVLITAMEYLREENNDDDTLTGNHKDVLNIAQVTMFEGTTGQEDPRPEDDESPQDVKAPIPKKKGLSAISLKNIGRESWHQSNNLSSPEKKVLPGFVVVASLVYFGVAATSFLEEDGFN